MGHSQRAIRPKNLLMRAASMSRRMAYCDLPPIRVIFEEIGNPHGAYGAKGIGELPMDGPAPAIVNAVVDALGIAFDSVPLLPEEVLEAVMSRSIARTDSVTAEFPC